MNGYIFANNPVFEMCVNDKAVWYLYNFGFDFHAAHWHGNNVQYKDITTAVVPMLAGQAVSTLMTAVNPGTWQVICHDNSHLFKGMESLYTIYGENCPLTPLST